MINKLKGRRRQKLFERYEGDFRHVTVEEVNGLIDEFNEEITALEAEIPTSNYKVYTARLVQNGANAPAVTIMDNTLGGTITWASTATGIVKGTPIGFTYPTDLGKIWCQADVKPYSADSEVDADLQGTAGEFTLATWDSSGALQNGFYMDIEIRIYN